MLTVALLVTVMSQVQTDCVGTAVGFSEPVPEPPPLLPLPLPEQDAPCSGHRQIVTVSGKVEPLCVTSSR